MQTNVKPFAEVKGNVAESHINKTFTNGGTTPPTNLGMADGWKSPMFTGR